MTKVKAIETKAFGCRFRSRLEARWAVFFTELGCRWEYEPQGFMLEHSGAYLPDFFVYDFPHYPSPIWVEVKQNDPSIEEVNKLRELCCATGHYGYFAVESSIAYGFRQKSPFQRIIDTFLDQEEENRFKISWPLNRCQVPHSTFYALGQERCFQGKEKVEQLAFFTELLCKSFNEPPAADFYHAAVAARSARFEHGESPR